MKIFILSMTGKKHGIELIDCTIKPTSEASFENHQDQPAIKKGTIGKPLQLVLAVWGFLACEKAVRLTVGGSPPQTDRSYL